MHWLLLSSYCSENSYPSFTSIMSSGPKCTSNVTSISFAGSSGAPDVWLQPKPHRTPVKYFPLLSTLHEKERKQSHQEMKKLNSYEDTLKWVCLSHAKQETCLKEAKTIESHPHSVILVFKIYSDETKLKFRLQKHILIKLTKKRYISKITESKLHCV